MPPLRDPEIRAKILEALSVSERGEGIRWSKPALDELERVLPKIRPQQINRILRLWVEQGKQVDQCRETRPEWQSTAEFHYDFRISIGGCLRYIECRLLEDSPNHPELFFVSFHDA